MFTFGPYYPNIAPVITPTNSPPVEDFCSVQFTFDVTDANHLPTEVIVSISDTENYLLTTTDVGTYKKTVNVSVKGSASDIERSVVLTATDGGIMTNLNPMSTTMTISFKYKTQPSFTSVLISVTTKIIFRFAGDWYFDPEYDSTLTPTISITNADPSIKLISTLTGLIMMAASDINTKTAGAEIQVTYKVEFSECSCCTAPSDSILKIQIKDPPLILPPDPVYYYYSCPYSIPLNIIYYQPSDLVLSYTNFTPTSTINADGKITLS